MRKCSAAAFAPVTAAESAALVLIISAVYEHEPANFLYGYLCNFGHTTTFTAKSTEKEEKEGEKGSKLLQQDKVFYALAGFGKN